MAVGSEFQPVHTCLSSRMNFIQQTQKIHSPRVIEISFSLDESPRNCASSTVAAHSLLPSLGCFLLPSWKKCTQVFLGGLHVHFRIDRISGRSAGSSRRLRRHH